MTELIKLLAAVSATVFESLVRASIQGGIFILLVWIVCRFLPQLPASARCVLWWLASLKILVAFVCVDPLPVPVLEPSPPSPVVVSGSASLVMTRAESPTHGAAPADSKRAEALGWTTSLAVGAWAAILTLLLTALAHRMRSIKRIAVRAVEAPPEIEELAARLCESIRLARTPAVRISQEIDTPLVLGFRRPVVLLPERPFAGLRPDEQRMALCHELLHLQRRDLWLACIPALAERLFFFHPLVHLAVREYQLTREAACDAAVIRTLDARLGDYGRLLLALGISRLPMHLAAAGSPSSYLKLKRRITMLRDTSKHSPRLRTASWAVVLLATFAITPLTFVARSQDRQDSAQAAISKQSADGPSPAVGAVRPAAPASPAQAVSPSAPQRKAREKDLNYVLFFRDDDSTMMSGSSDDVSRARSLREGKEQMLWFRRGGREYVVRDLALLREVEEVYRPLQQIGGEQAKIGSKQAEIGKKQAAIGSKQAELGARQAQVGSKQAAFAARQAGKERADRDELEKERRQLEFEMQQLDGEMQELSGQMQAFNSPMDQLSKDMNSLSEEMNALSRKMEEASAKAQAEMSGLLDRAISSGAAKEVK